MSLKAILYSPSGAGTGENAARKKSGREYTIGATSCNPVPSVPMVQTPRTPPISPINTTWEPSADIAGLGDPLENPPA